MVFPVTPRKPPDMPDQSMAFPVGQGLPLFLSLAGKLDLIIRLAVVSKVFFVQLRKGASGICGS